MGRKSAMTTIATAVLCAAFLAGGVATAFGGVKIIPPEKLRPLYPGRGYVMRYAWISADSSDGDLFYAPVKLPVGARITRLSYYHWGDGGAITMVSLNRVKMGTAINKATDTLMLKISSLAVPDTIPPEEVTTTTPYYDTSDMIVRRGYRYFVRATSPTRGQKIGGIKVYYR